LQAYLVPRKNWKGLSASGMRRYQPWLKNLVEWRIVKWAIESAMRNATPDRVTEGKRISNFDARAASAAIARLRTLIESCDGDAAESFVALEDTLADICDKPRLSALSAAIDEFDFDGARKKLEEITKEYGTNWELSK